MTELRPGARTLVEVVDGPTIVCDGGWGGLRHDRIVLTFGAHSDISHGMCERCRLMMDAEITMAGKALEAYREYLAGSTDPRD